MGTRSLVQTATGSPSLPAGVSMAWFIVAAGGASGGATNAGAGPTGVAGGGAGEYCHGVMGPVSGSISCTIGLGGAVSTFATGQVNAGGDSAADAWIQCNGGRMDNTAGWPTNAHWGGGPNGGQAGSGPPVTNNEGLGFAETNRYFGGTGAFHNATTDRHLTGPGNSDGATGGGTSPGYGGAGDLFLSGGVGGDGTPTGSNGHDATGYGGGAGAAGAPSFSTGFNSGRGADGVVMIFYISP